MASPTIVVVLHLFFALLAQAASTPPPPPPPTTPQVFVLDLKPVGVAPEKAQILSARLAQTFVQQGLQVVTSADLRHLADLEAERMALGCDDATATCIAEIANALGARFVVNGQVGQLDTDRLFLQVSLFDAQQGRAIAREEAGGSSFGALDDAVPAVVARLLSGTMLQPSSSAAVAARGPAPLVVAGGIVGGVGGVGLVGGAFWGSAINRTLGKADGAPADKVKALDQRLPALITLGSAAVVTVVGAALLVVGLVQE